MVYAHIPLCHHLRSYSINSQPAVSPTLANVHWDMQVVIDMSEPEHGNTVVNITQTEVPLIDKFGNEDTVDVTERGWQSQVLQRIRQVFGYGV